LADPKVDDVLSLPLKLRRTRKDFKRGFGLQAG
jgi:hypothetical protein